MAAISAVLAALAISIGIIYGKTAWFDFVNFDDSDYITQNRHVLAGLTWAGFRWAFTTFHGANWFPVTWLSHMTDASFFGPWAGGHHLVSLAFHGVNSALLAILLYRMTRAFWKAALVAALFALHPLHVESVAWVSERKDLLSTFFFLTALLAYLRYTANRSLRNYLLVALLFTLGLMAKPMVTSLPLILLLLDWWPLQRCTPHEATSQTRSNDRGRNLLPLQMVLEKTPLLLLSAASAIVTILAQSQGEAIVSAEVLPLFQRIGRMFVHDCWYLAKLAWPSDLAFYYPVATHLPLWKQAAAATAIIAISALALKRSRMQPYLLAGWFWFIITLLPVIGLVAVGMQGTADRYAYIPSIGFFMVLVWLAEALLEKTNCRLALAIVLSSAILSVLALLTWRQVDVWRNSTTLSEHAVKVTRDNYVAMTILGDSLDDNGKGSEAVSYYRQALRIRPEYEIARNSLGVALCRQGQTDDAMRELSNAVRLRPSYADAYVNMGVCMISIGKHDDAINAFRHALSLNPDHYTAAEYLSQTLAGK